MNIILGTAQLMNNYGIVKKDLKNNQLNKILDYAKKNKYNFIDTALAYKRANNILSKYDLSRFNIITKVNRLKKNTTVEKINNSKLNLNINKFHTVLLHDENELISKQAQKNYKILKKIKLKKLTKYIGVSVYSKKKTMKIIRNFKIDALQVPGNIFDRRFFDKDFIKIVKKKKLNYILDQFFYRACY